MIAATTVLTTSPVTTGSNSLRARSTTDTPQKVATAISDDQMTRVPPPVHDAPFWAMAAGVAVSTRRGG
ncbi:MAG: hypothetical protein WA890_16865 [Micromonospora sp.]